MKLCNRLADMTVGLCRRLTGPRDGDRAALEKVTLLIKTFERPAALARLLDSIGRFYGMYGDSLRILVADDSRETYRPVRTYRNRVDIFPLPFDSGLSAGRNHMLDRVQTPYFVLLDDDFVFTRATRLERFVRVLDTVPGIDILGGRIRDKGKKMMNGSRSVQLEKGVLRKSRRPAGTAGGLPVYHFVLNFFAARTGSVRNVRWRDEFKVVEHTAFFLDCMHHGLTVAELDTVTVDHYPQSHPEYLQFRRDRTERYIRLLHERFGLKEIIG